MLASEEDESTNKHAKTATRCVWPDKPRLPDNKFKKICAECRKQCPEACFAFLVGTCKEASCPRLHEVLAAFKVIKQNFRYQRH